MNSTTFRVKLWQPVPSNFSYSSHEILLSDTFTRIGKREQELTILAFKYYLLKIQPKKPLRILKLNFDAKFEQISANNIILHYEGCIQNFQIQGDSSKISKWVNFLSSKINQIGFASYFKLLRQIGAGTFAKVYEGIRKSDGLRVAVKKFSKAIYSQQNGRETLINEIYCMRSLPHHENVLKLYSVFETQNSIYFILEFLEGGSLYDQLQKNVSLSLNDIKIIMFGILKGLSHLHQNNIMHRDLKLENLLFRSPQQYDQIVIIDFGLATSTLAQKYLYSRCGTPGYVAPEIISIVDPNTIYQPVCDIFSVGCIFHILLIGKPIFPAKSYQTLVKQNIEAKIDFRSKLYKNLPRDAFELLKRMLQKEPIFRISSELALQVSYFQGLNLQARRCRKIFTQFQEETKKSASPKNDVRDQSQSQQKTEVNQAYSPLQSPSSLIKANKLNSLTPMQPARKSLRQHLAITKQILNKQCSKNLIVQDSSNIRSQFFKNRIGIICQ